MTYYIASDRFGNYDLAHHGILGMKWGVRRYQNRDGSWTTAGRARYGKSGSGESWREKQAMRRHAKTVKMLTKQSAKNEKLAARLEKRGKTAKAAVLREMNKQNQEAINNPSAKKAQSYRDVVFGGQKWMNSKRANLNMPINRLEEHQIQIGMRATLKYMTSEKTLRRMTAEEGANYTRSKYITSYTYGKALNRGHSAGYKKALKDAGIDPNTIKKKK